MDNFSNLSKEIEYVKKLLYLNNLNKQIKSNLFDSQIVNDYLNKRNISCDTYLKYCNTIFNVNNKILNCENTICIPLLNYNKKENGYQFRKLNEKKFIKISLEYLNGYNEKQYWFDYYNSYKENLIITEGTFDALSLKQLLNSEDFDYCATLGINVNLIKYFSKLYKRIIVCYDNDFPGINTMYNLSNSLLENLYFMKFNKEVYKYKDLNEFLINEKTFDYDILTKSEGKVFFANLLN